MHINFVYIILLDSDKDNITTDDNNICDNALNIYGEIIILI